MNPYNHKSINNPHDVRLVECFLHQNPENEWLLIEDIASWVYQTNQPTEQHKSYVFYKLVSILGMPGTKESKASFVQRGYVTTDGEEEFAFRLKARTMLKGMRVLTTEINSGRSSKFERARVAELT